MKAPFAICRLPSVKPKLHVILLRFTANTVRWQTYHLLAIPLGEQFAFLFYVVVTTALRQDAESGKSVKGTCERHVVTVHRTDNPSTR